MGKLKATYTVSSPCELTPDELSTDELGLTPVTITDSNVSWGHLSSPPCTISGPGPETKDKDTHWNSQLALGDPPGASGAPGTRGGNILKTICFLQQSRHEWFQ